MIKLRSKRFSRSSSKNGNSNGNKAASSSPAEKDCRSVSEIKWELRPGGMLVQKRESNQSSGEGMITIRVSTVSKWHDISIEATSTFGKSHPTPVPLSLEMILGEFGTVRTNKLSFDLRHVSCCFGQNSILVFWNSCK